MAGKKKITEIWNTIQEFDLRPIREAALQPVHLAIVGVAGSGRHALADILRCDPASPAELTQTPVLILTPEQTTNLPAVDFVLVTALPEPDSLSQAQNLVRRCTDAGLRVLLFCQITNSEETQKVLASLDAPKALLTGDIEDQNFLLKRFVPIVTALLPEAQHLALGRQFPLFRTAIARSLINDTCLANATYSFSTGLAEAIPAFTIPLSVTDMVVLTKSQAFLAYKLGLLLGFSTHWQDYLKEFGSVVGSGFVMRQLARQLIGLIPAWGIAPKIAIAYSGTYIVGHTILQWYLAGRKIHRDKLQTLSRLAILEGKIMAYRIIEKAPKLKFKRKTSKDTLAKNHVPVLGNKTNRFKLGWGHKVSNQVCPTCAKTNSHEAAFCQYCGQALQI